jgi:hypothetical protein
VDARATPHATSDGVTRAHANVLKSRRVIMQNIIEKKKRRRGGRGRKGNEKGGEARKAFIRCAASIYPCLY